MTVLKPLFNKIVVRKIVPEQKVSAGGIVLTGAPKDFPDTATVIATSDGIYEGNVFRPIRVKAGDVVLLPKDTGTEAKFDGIVYHVINELDIFAIVNKD